MPAAQAFSVAGKVAFITGASSGFGKHFAKVLAREGAKVGLAARRVDVLQSLAQEIRGAGGVGAGGQPAAAGGAAPAQAARAGSPRCWWRGRSRTAPRRGCAVDSNRYRLSRT